MFICVAEKQIGDAESTCTASQLNRIESNKSVMCFDDDADLQI